MHARDAGGRDVLENCGDVGLGDVSSRVGHRKPETVRYQQTRTRRLDRAGECAAEFERDDYELMAR